MTRACPSPLLVATSNAHKVREIAEIFRELALHPLPELRSAADFPDIPPPEENGETFAANALIKAQAYGAASGLAALADDSGLVIDALDGRPGIHSARYAPTQADQIARVLRELQTVPPELRSARFVCAVALARTDGEIVTAEGRVEGYILDAPRGEHGFGYDPIFEPVIDGKRAGRSLAEFSAAEKNAISHRGRALRALFVPNEVKS